MCATPEAGEAHEDVAAPRGLAGHMSPARQHGAMSLLPDHIGVQAAMPHDNSLVPQTHPRGAFCQNHQAVARH